jgi:hypothetical protein
MYLHPALLNDLAAANRAETLRRAARQPARDTVARRHPPARNRAAPKLRLRIRLSRSF